MQHVNDNDRTEKSDYTRSSIRALRLTPDVFMPHRGLNDEVNSNIAQSEIEGGVHLDELSAGVVLKVETQHHWYTIVNRSDGEA